LTGDAKVPGEKSGGLFLTLEELSAIVPWLQKNEEHLGVRERQILNRMERILYEYLSIEEIEKYVRGPAGYA